MRKYIDADKLIAEIERRLNIVEPHKDTFESAAACRQELIWMKDFITSLQQDDAQVDKMLCSQIWWGEQGWIMIPPDATIEGIDSLLKQVRKKLQQEQQEVNKFDCPATPIEEAIEVTSRMQYIDEELKPIARFIMDYASWNLHKDEWNQPVIEVPLFRVLDALAQKGKPYCCAG